MRPLDDFRPAHAALLAAATLPSLLAYNEAPSPTFLNQALAFITWGFVALAVALEPRLPALRRRDWRASAPVLVALACVVMAAVVSSGVGGLPASLALSGIGTLLAAAILVLAGAQASRGPASSSVFAALCMAWVVAGLLNAAIAALQVFAPSWADGDWIARSGIPGRAVGNLRQPNHLSSLLMWAAIAIVGLMELRRIAFRHAVAVMSVIVFGIVLTASRTGVIGVLLLAGWALVDRRLARTTRRLLAGAPIIYVAGWLAMAAWAHLAQATFGGEKRLAEADLSASRFAIWSDTWTLIRHHPWTGVGFGEFNFAWTLSPMPHRPPAFFDHSHNLVLELAVELGIPMAILILSLLLWAMWRGLMRVRVAAGDASLMVRCALAMLVLIGLHSLLEYPLWYSYFLLPASFAFGLAVGVPTDAPPVDNGSAPRWAMAAMAAAVALGALMAVADYRRVVAIFNGGEDAPPLQMRIERGRASVLFSHHADYAAATVATDPAQELASFARAAHFLIDTRLLMGWAQALAQSGDDERAVYLAQRLREFRNPASAAFLAECESPTPEAAAATPFQCRSQNPALGWRDFIRR